jgi:hypothetical protein
MDALVLLLLPVLLGAFVTFDQLIRREYAAHRADWERDGRPHGFFWRPPVTDRPDWLARAGWSLAQWRVMGWLFRTPLWAATDSRAVRLLRRLRILVLVWNVGIGVGVVVAG